MLNHSRRLSTVPITTYLYKYYSNNLLGCICLLNRSFKAPFSHCCLYLFQAHVASVNRRWVLADAMSMYAACMEAGELSYALK